MASGAIDISGNITVTNTAMENKYKYINKSDKAFVLSLMALTSNTTFQSLGKLKLRVGNEVLTSSGDKTNEVPMTQNLNVEFPPMSASPLLWKVIMPNEEVDVDAYVSSGTGTMQVALFGRFIDVTLLEALQARERRELGMV